MGTRLQFLISLCLLKVHNCREYVDMTYELFEGLPKTTVTPDFKQAVIFEGPWLKTKFFASYKFESAEHMGTHIDAPFHFNRNASYVNEIPFENLHGPGVVLDIRERVKKMGPGKEATVKISDAKAWEKKYGKIPKGAIVIMNSGWGKHWPDVNKFIGLKDPDNPDGLVPSMLSPGFSKKLARWLLKERYIIGIATDTINCDKGSAVNYDVHNILLPQEKWCVEMIANVEQIPVNGTEIFVMPIKIRGGTGAPARIFAMWN
ncbi:unnamed protein product [Owenia fusiformis]|uniref:Uncharacterized protein n=1 Tax=Owenia fusiformis TaxID=6347 RepID=A0A8J1TLW0_OWEFU|nr:unnamed protein product [Owenia fusiformis]